MGFLMDARTEWNLIERMLVGDFNPHHDPDDGRFTSGGGLTSRNTSDVTDEYFAKAKPGSGRITKEPGYNDSRHKEEIAFANYLHDTFGGDLVLLNESGIDGQKTPDYRWRGRSWEYKQTSSLGATDDQLRTALKQIRSTPGGVILSYKKVKVPISKIVSVVNNRLARSSGLGVDVMIVVNNKVVRVLREK